METWSDVADAWTTASAGAVGVSAAHAASPPRASRASRLRGRSALVIALRDIVMGRLGLMERLLYDTREVSNRSPFQDRTHVFWVMEGAREVRYEVDTSATVRGRILAIRRNGKTVFEHGT